jgi:hypothetical protein
MSLADADHYAESRESGPAPGPEAWKARRTRLRAEREAERERQRQLVLLCLPHGRHGLSLADLTEACVREDGIGWRAATPTVVRELVDLGLVTVHEGVVYRRAATSADVLPSGHHENDPTAPMPPSGPEWGAWARARRGTLGLSQGALAKQIGRAASSVSNAERGETKGYDVARLRSEVEAVLGPFQAQGEPALAGPVANEQAHDPERSGVTTRHGDPLLVGDPPGEHAAEPAQPSPSPEGCSPSGAPAVRPGVPGEPSGGDPASSPEPVSGGEEADVTPPSSALGEFAELRRVVAAVDRLLDRAEPLHVRRDDDRWQRLGALGSVIDRIVQRSTKEAK